MKLAMWGLAILLVSPLTIVAAASAHPQDATQSDQQQDPLAAAARRAREQKKDEPKAAKVWDNDNIPTAPNAVSVVGSPAADNSTQPVPDAQGQAANSNEQPKPEDKAAAAADLNADKQQLQTLKTDLDILQRKFVLDQATYYGKPDYQSDREGASMLTGEQSQIDSKQKAIDDLQKNINDLQSKVGTSGGNPSSGNSSGGNSSGGNPSSGDQQ
jgi:hypothetical protein